MEIGAILISALLLFLVIYFSVSLAIKPLLNKPETFISEDTDSGLIKLRDMEVLNASELEEVIKIYKNKSIQSENLRRYQKYEKVLKELKDIGYFSEEQYLNKLEKLKKYFKLN